MQLPNLDLSLIIVVACGALVLYWILSAVN